MEKQHTVVVFAGAGASAAVSGTKYPTTTQFFERLPDDVKNNQLFDQVLAYLRRDDQEAHVDIELILWELGKLRDFLDLYRNRREFPGWVFEQNRLATAVVGKGLDLRTMNQLATSGTAEIKKLIDRINATVYDLYGQLPDQKELEATWLPLLRGLERMNLKVELFTTNYDLILESALAEVPVSDDGTRGPVVREVVPTLWQRGHSKGLLTKLHGSIHWRRDQGKILVSDHKYKGNHAYHAIIYPGFKGTPTEGAFQAFHEHLGRALSAASCAVFVGFAFRDDFINEICSSNLAGNTQVRILNPAPTLALPALNVEHEHWSDSFTAKTAQRLLEFVETVISA